DVDHQPVHLHSMLVHAVIAFVPLAAVSFVLDASGTTVGGIEPGAWRLLLWGALAGMLVVAVPAVLTGISERNHMYANWPRSHRVKLVLSLLLVVMVVGELVALRSGAGAHGLFSGLGLAIVVGNCGAALALSYFGLRITLGRQNLESTSYVADVDREPRVDILDVAAEYVREEPKLIDVQKEGGG
ncbi:MAG: hypothetical protein ACC742_13175, partial [Thermoanaerobaculales bacterium]